MRNNNFKAKTATMATNTAEAGAAGTMAAYGAAGQNGDIFLTANEQESSVKLGRGAIGIIVALISSIPALLELLSITVFTGVMQDIMLVLVPIGALVSYIIVGFRDCTSLIWRVIRSGFYFPVWPINFLVGIMTFALGGALGILLPVVVIGIVMLRNR